ncbi:MAG: type II secretion system F family protein [Betaproteobacteria bacterium]|nr:type II secretion system F family protein [Betaproteobacteria bacterium]
MFNRATETARQHRFLWEGRDRHGQSMRGEMKAANVLTVQAQLRRQGIFMTHVHQARWAGCAALSRPERVAFTRQLASMARSSLPLLQSLDLMARGPGKPGLRRIAQQLRLDVATGQQLSSAMARHPKSFPALYRQLVAVGEAAGVMDHTLERLALHEEKAWALRRQMRAALLYPAVVVGVAGAVVALILAVVVPTFESVFASFGAELPLPTQLVVAASQALMAAWWPMLAGLVVAAGVYRWVMTRWPALKRLANAAPLHLPLLGLLIRRALLARWARTLATLLEAGIPLVDALGSVAQAAGNPAFEQATRQVQRSVCNGQRLSQALEGAAVFPPLVVQMASVGEEAGALERMMGKTAELFEAEVDDEVKGLSSLLEPLIIVILGTLIGGIVVALYLPMFQLGSIV